MAATDRSSSPGSVSTIRTRALPLSLIDVTPDDDRPRRELHVSTFTPDLVPPEAGVTAEQHGKLHARIFLGGAGEALVLGLVVMLSLVRLGIA